MEMTSIVWEKELEERAIVNVTSRPTSSVWEVGSFGDLFHPLWVPDQAHRVEGSLAKEGLEVG